MKLPKPIRFALSACLLAGLLVSGASPASAERDTDGDGLYDVWETDGLDVDGDGTVDLDFPAWGASPFRKDLFVEMDYMPGLLATEEELQKITEIFAELPIENPDGTEGITIHLDAGDARSDQFNLGGGNEIPHERIPNLGRIIEYRRANSDPHRKGFFHYMVWGDWYGNNGSSGLGFVNGQEFMVTVGPRYWGRASSNVRIGTFIHELGHNLGLGHGGTDGVNYKPHYMSVMNYSYQFSGAQRADGTSYHGYTHRAMESIDEHAVDEHSGAGPQGEGYLMSWSHNRKNKKSAAEGPFDANLDGVISEQPYEFDVNHDGRIGVLTAPSDVDHIRFQVRPPRAGRERDLPEIPDEDLTPELARKLGLID